MLRITTPVTALIALLAAISHSPKAVAEGALFLFPHMDLQQRTAPPDSLSFGTR